MIALGAKAASALRRHGEGMDLAIDAALAHAPGDELGHLAAEIEDEDAVGHGVGIIIGGSGRFGASAGALHHRDEEPVGAVPRRRQAQHLAARRAVAADRRRARRAPTGTSAKSAWPARKRSTCASSSSRSSEQVA